MYLDFPSTPQGFSIRALRSVSHFLSHTNLVFTIPGSSLYPFSSTTSRTRLIRSYLKPLVLWPLWEGPIALSGDKVNE